MERIALIAGGGELPVILAKKARKKGVKVIGFAIKKMASPDLDVACDRVHWFDLSQVNKFFFMLLIERVKKIVMLGKVDKTVIYEGIKKGNKGLNHFKGLEDKSDYAVLDKITSEFEKRGIKVISGIEYLSDLFPTAGVLTKKQPSEKEREDISFGFKMAKEIARLDIGQTIIVKDKTVVSVEAMEGTDRTIERAAKLCGEGFVVVKTSRPEQDMRWDIPVIGPATIRQIADSRGAVLALEAKKMFLVDKEACIKLADDNNISIVVM